MKKLNKQLHMTLGNNVKDLELDDNLLEVLTSLFALLIGVDKEETKKEGKVC